MHRKRSGAAVLHGAGKLDRVDMVLVPALAELDGDRQGNRLDDRLGDPAREGGIFHERAAAPVARDLGRRTAHVDVNHVGTVVERLFCRLCQDVWLVPEELHRDRPFGILYAEQLGGFLIGVVHPLGARHFADHIGRAELLADLAEGAVRHARHRRERRRPFDFDVPDLHGSLPVQNFFKFHMIS